MSLNFRQSIYTSMHTKMEKTFARKPKIHENNMKISEHENVRPLYMFHS